MQRREEKKLAAQTAGPGFQNATLKRMRSTQPFLVAILDGKALNTDARYRNWRNVRRLASIRPSERLCAAHIYGAVPPVVNCGLVD